MRDDILTSDREMISGNQNNMFSREIVVFIPAKSCNLLGDSLLAFEAVELFGSMRSLLLSIIL